MYAYLALAGLQLAGGYQNAEITRQNGELQDNIAKMNSQFAELDAFNARAKGQGDAARYETNVDQTIGADKSAEAGAGIDVNYGTAKQVETENRVAGMQNAAQIKRQAENTALGYENQAINIRLGGAMSKLQAGLNASAQEAAGVMGAIGTGTKYMDFANSTGKGFTANTGSNTGTGWKQQVGSTMSVNETGDGVQAAYVGMDSPPYYRSNITYDNGYGWYDTQSDNPFFGRGPRESYGSFTGETA